MPIYIAILRGINVSGHNKIPMADLKKLFEELKCDNIRTYIQSGNVIFEHTKSTDKALIKKIEKGISDKFGFDVPVLVITAGELEKVIKNNPFIKEKDIETDKLHVTFLAEPPAKANIDKANSYNFEPDRFSIDEKAAYVYCPNGYGNTKLNNTFFESKLKVTATTRNWRTVNELVRIAGE